jgi:2'-5' RNA ligase
VGFDFDTYVVLDVPAPIGDQVMAIRKRHRDEFRASLPVEISVSGAGGVGVFDPTQDPKEAFGVLETIASETAPIEASFGEVLRFPNTDIFVLTLEDERPFHALHERISRSGLRFKPGVFPYKPHCTLGSRSPISEKEAAELLSLRIIGSFVLDTMSVYMIDELPMTLLHRVKLTGDADTRNVL